MQLLGKFKRILYTGFKATLNFRNFKLALNPMYRIFLNFAKSYIDTSKSKSWKELETVTSQLKLKET